MSGQLTGKEVRARVDVNNKEIQRELNKFVLTDRINQLLQENEELRHVCPHEFVRGICIYCDLPEEFDE